MASTSVGRRPGGIEREVGDLAQCRGSLDRLAHQDLGHVRADGGPMVVRLQAGREGGRARVEPHDEVPRVAQGGSARRVVEGARRGADDGRAGLPERLEEVASLQRVQRIDAVARGVLAAGHPGLALDVGVGVAMRHAERGGQRGPDRGLAAPHQPDQHDVAHVRSVPSLGHRGDGPHPDDRPARAAVVALSDGFRYQRARERLRLSLKARRQLVPLRGPGVSLWVTTAAR